MDSSNFLVFTFFTIRVPWVETEIGIGLTGLGFLFLLLGVLFFFDKGLIALGNVSL